MRGSPPYLQALERQQANLFEFIEEYGTDFAELRYHPWMDIPHRPGGKRLVARASTIVTGIMGVYLQEPTSTQRSVPTQLPALRSDADCHANSHVLICALPLPFLIAGSPSFSPTTREC